MATLWTDEYREKFVRAVLHETRRLGLAQAGFKMTSWTRIMDATNASTGFSFVKTQLQSQLQTLKGKYVMYSSLKNNSGFGSHIESGHPTAPQDVWDAYFAAHPKVPTEWQNVPLLLYDELHEIFSSVIATGRYAAESSDAVSNRSDAGSSSDGDSDGDPPSSHTGSPRQSPSVAADLPSSQLKRSRTPTKQQQTSGERISGALEKLVETHERRTKQKTAMLNQPRALKRTQAQLALQHFNETYSTIMTQGERLKYIQFFICNPAAAEAYIVLDTDMKEAFISSLFQANN